MMCSSRERRRSAISPAADASDTLEAASQHKRPAQRGDKPSAVVSLPKSSRSHSSSSVFHTSLLAAPSVSTTCCKNSCKKLRTRAASDYSHEGKRTRAQAPPYPQMPWVVNIQRDEHLRIAFQRHLSVCRRCIQTRGRSCVRTFGNVVGAQRHQQFRRLEPHAEQWGERGKGGL